MRLGSAALLFRAVACLCGGCALSGESAPVRTDAASALPARAMQIRVLAQLRDIDALVVAPDLRRYAIRVRQADVDANTYRLEWFVARLGEPLESIGDGGEVVVDDSGHIAGGEGKWSPDGRALAFLVRRDAATQIWLTEGTGSARQLTRNAADVRSFRWTPAGDGLVVEVGASRADMAARSEQLRRNGIRMDDFDGYAQMIYPGLPAPAESKAESWIVSRRGGDEHSATVSEIERETRTPAEGRRPRDLVGTTSLVAEGPAGLFASLQRVRSQDAGAFPVLQVRLSSLSERRALPLCSWDECIGQNFKGLWWNAHELVIWRGVGMNQSEDAFFAWAPRRGTFRKIYHVAGDRFRECQKMERGLLCIRESLMHPDHLATLDLESGIVEIAADLNPQIGLIKRGKVEAFEWRLPPDEAQLGFARRGRGFILYPPDFDPTQRYPVFIAPYSAGGFPRGDVGDEQPLLVYAAHGMVVINTEFPFPLGAAATDVQSRMMARLYDKTHDFPYLRMLVKSTFNALDEVASRGFVDLRRVGIGGVSHGSFVPVFMLQEADRLAAVSAGSRGWSIWEPFTGTPQGDQRYAERAHGDWRPRDREYWSRIDISQHAESVEAPILFQFAASEGIYYAPLVLRQLHDAARPYDAYLFPGETHVKWQPAHRLAVYARNLDWFRFWLQDIEDTDPAKHDQYKHWRGLRELQCHNPRSTRDYCHIVSARVPVAR